MTILICHPTNELLDLISFSLESQLGVEVCRASNFREAIEYLLEENLIDLVITSHQAETDNLFKYLLSTGASIPVILITKNTEEKFAAYPDLQVLGHVPLSELSENLLPLVRKHFQDLHNSDSNGEYCRIQTALLTRVTPLRGDVFIRLSRIKFVKLFKTGATFTQQDLEKFLVRKKVSYLYIKKNESQEFVQKFSEDLAQIVANAKPDDPSLNSTATDVHDMTIELYNRLGLTPGVQAIVKSNVNLTIKAIGVSPKLSKVLSATKMKDKNYISSHSVILANISCAIAAQMNWPSETTFKKLVLASFFHDFLFQNPDLAKISNKRDLERVRFELGEESFNAIKNHPMACAEVVKTLHEIPSDVHTVILQHHERPDGSGFPKGLRGQHIAPLSAVFIIAHDILDVMLENSEPFDLKAFLNTKEPEYQGLTFKKIVKTLLSQPGSISDSDAA